MAPAGPYIGRSDTKDGTSRATARWSANDPPSTEPGPAVTGVIRVSGARSTRTFTHGKDRDRSAAQWIGRNPSFPNASSDSGRCSTMYSTTNFFSACWTVARKVFYIFVRVKGAVERRVALGRACLKGFGVLLDQQLDRGDRRCGGGQVQGQRVADSGGGADRLRIMLDQIFHGIELHFCGVLEGELALHENAVRGRQVKGKPPAGGGPPPDGAGGCASSN
jgi:hypothetical protein